MSFSTITLRTDLKGIATLTLDRPEKHNALSAEMIAEITDAAIKLSNDTSIRALILSGNGKSFCAGGDLAWIFQTKLGVNKFVHVIVESYDIHHDVP